MPKRHMQTHMIVKTPEGYIKVDKNNNRKEVVDEELLDILGDIGALSGEAEESYRQRKEIVDKPSSK